MIDNLYSMNLLHSVPGLAVATCIGFLFGFFLEIAGFGSSRKLTHIFYFRDMAVLKVMFTAVLVALIGYQYLAILGVTDPTQIYALETFLGAQAIGGLVFGIGFVMGGWCPGTAIVGVASLKWDALVFLIGAIVGSILFNETFISIQPLYESGAKGISLLPDVLEIRASLFITLLSIGAVFMFALSTWIETKSKYLPLLTFKEKKKNQWMALVLILSSALLLILPEAPKPLPKTELMEKTPPLSTIPSLSSTTPQELFQEIVQEKDHFDPILIAKLLMEEKSDIHLVDIRPAQEYQAFHLRGAINIPLEEMQQRAFQELPKENRIILYSNGTTHAAQAWVILKQMGWPQVFVILNGISGFVQDCLTPPSLNTLLDETTAKIQYADYQKRRDYFLNKPVASPIEKKPEEIFEAFTPGGLDAKLVSVEWLVSQLDNPALRILDVRDKSTEYTTSHIPNALYLNTENIRAMINGIPSQLVPPEDLAKIFGRIGISEKHTIIIYDQNLRNATLFAVALDRLGHNPYAILHGGFPEWLKQKHPVAQNFSSFEPQIYTFKPEADTFTLDISGVQKALQEPKKLLIDVRPEEYYRGEKSEESRPGHIPGAVNRPFHLDIVPGKAYFKTVENLTVEYEKLGLKPNEKTIVSCRTGHQASQTYFVLKHLLKHPNVFWFDASWSGWSAQKELPVEQTSKK